MNALRVTVCPPRLHVGGLRVHHGLTGVVMAVAGLLLRRRGVFTVGALLVLEDFRDWPWSLFDPR